MKKMIILLGLVFGFAILILVTIPSVITSYNTLVEMTQQISQADASLNAVYVKRLSLVDNLINIAREYSQFEKTALNSIVSARYIAERNPETISSNKILAVFESYPGLVSSSHYSQVSVQLISIETEIQQSKFVCNKVIKEYNTYISIFPTNIVAKIFGYSTKQQYLVSTDVSKDPVTISR